MTTTQFVAMYHPLIPSTATAPAMVAAQAVDERYAKGWLLVDPDALPPTPSTPYYTKEALLSQIQGGAAPIGTALRAASVAAAEESGKFAPGFPDHLEGVPVTVQGHSWTTMPGRYTPPGVDWPSRLSKRGLGPVTTHGISGQTMLEMAFSVIGDDWYTGVTGNTASLTNIRTWTPGGLGIVVVQGTINDGTRAGAGSDTAFQNGYKHALRTVLAGLTAGQRIEAQAGTLSGTWNSSSNKQASGGSLRTSPTAGAGVSYIEWANVTVPAGVDKVHVLTYVSDAATSLGLLDVSVDGVAAVTGWDPVGQMKQYVTPLGTNPTVSLGVISVPATPGARTIRVTHAAGRAVAAFVDALIVPTATPPLVLVCKEPPVPGLGYAANAALYNGFIDSVAAEFPATSVKVVDLAAGWSNGTMLGADGLHPNARGSRQVADTLDAAIRAAVTDYTVGVTHKIV